MTDPASNNEFTALMNALNRHAWTSHSIGTLKQKNIDDLSAPSDVDEVLRNAKKKSRDWERMAMNFAPRKAVEQGLVGSGALAASPTALFPFAPPPQILAYTSPEIYDHTATFTIPPDTTVVRFPPGTFFKKYFPRTSVKDPEVQRLFNFLSSKANLPAQLVDTMRTSPQSLNIVVEASRMDETKRKEILIEAMRETPANTILLMTGSRDEKGVYDSLASMITNFGLGNRVFLIGFVPDDLLGPLCSLPHGTNDDQFHLVIGAGASRMEGWGMSVMDTTAGGLPLVASDRTPYAVLLEREVNGALVVPLGENEPAQYAAAIKQLIADPAAARAMAALGREQTREFDWPKLVRSFVAEINRTFELTSKGIV